MVTRISNLVIQFVHVWVIRMKLWLCLDLDLEFKIAILTCRSRPLTSIYCHFHPTALSFCSLLRSFSFHPSHYKCRHIRPLEVVLHLPTLYYMLKVMD